MDIPQGTVIVIMLLLLANGIATLLRELRNRRQPTKTKPNRKAKYVD